jgi:hypothetical protein
MRVLPHVSWPTLAVAASLLANPIGLTTIPNMLPN